MLLGVVFVFDGQTCFQPRHHPLLAIILELLCCDHHCAVLVTACVQEVTDNKTIFISKCKTLRSYVAGCCCRICNRAAAPNTHSMSGLPGSYFRDSTLYLHLINQSSSQKANQKRERQQATVCSALLHHATQMFLPHLFSISLNHHENIPLFIFPGNLFWETRLLRLRNRTPCRRT